MEILGILFGILKVALVVGGTVLVVRATRSKGEMGVNLKRVSCCKCGADVPVIRKPKDKEEFMWGGWTCGKRPADGRVGEAKRRSSMKRTEETYRLKMAPSSVAKLLGVALVLCATLCLGGSCEAAGTPSRAMPTLTAPSPILAAKFSFLDDILGGFGKSGGKSYGYTYQGAQREKRRGERGFFYYAFQTILRLSSGVFLAYHAGTLVEKLGRGKARGMDTAAAIGGFVLSLIFPWIGFFIGGACWGLWKLSEDSGRTPPVR